MNVSINIKVNNSERAVKFNYILLGILGLSIVLRLYHLGFQGAWVDELYTLKQGDPDLSFKELHDINMFRDGIPHLYFLIVKFFGIIFGHTLYSIRLVSVVFGVLGVYGMYLLGKAVANKNTGYIAALLLAVHPFHIEYSQEGRSYSLLAFFVIMAVYRLVLFLKKVNLKNALYLGLFTGLITNAQPIGIISVLGVFFTVGICFFFLKSNKERIVFLKYSFLSGIVTLLVFAPVYQKVVVASKISSFWVLKPSYDYGKQVLTQITGGNLILLYLSIAALIVIAIPTFLKKDKSSTFVNSHLFGFLIVFVWIVFYFLFILIKSLGESSLFLHRYFIPIIPGIVLAMAMAVSLISNKIFRNIAVFSLTFLFVYSLVAEKKYYSTRVKSQFNDICLQIKNNNPANETVISSWGWLLTFYLDKDFTINNVYEKNLDVYINDVKTKAVIQESFWYIDGNSKPYSVSPEIAQFIAANYEVDKTIELHDAWAKHFVSKKAADNSLKTIRLNQFKNALFDGSGSLMFFENSKSASQPIFVAKGDYKLILSGKSLPSTKIKDENARINVYLNGKLYSNIELDEKAIQEYVLDFSQQTDGNLTIEMEFINDFWLDGQDRNAQISNIQLKKD